MSRLPAEQAKDKADFRVLPPWWKARPNTEQFSERMRTQIRDTHWKRHQDKKESLADLRHCPRKQLLLELRAKKKRQQAQEPHFQFMPSQT